MAIKHITNKYAGSDDLSPPVVIPEGPIFRDMIKLKGWTCNLLLRSYIIACYLADEQTNRNALQAELKYLAARQIEPEEEHGASEQLVYNKYQQLSVALVVHDKWLTALAALKQAMMTGRTRLV